MKKHRETIQKFFFNFIASFSLLFLLVTILSSFSENNRILNKRAEITNNESNLIRIQKELIASDFEQIRWDMRVLHKLFTDKNIYQLVQDASYLLDHKPNYRALTYISSSNQMVKLKQNTDTYEVILGRDTAFYQSIKPNLKMLSPDDIFISNIQFSLNTESMFYEPMIYFGTPHIENNQTIGWILLDVSLESMFLKFKDLRATSTGEMMLLSRRGDYFIDKQNLLLNNPSAISFAAQKPFVWQNITTRSSPFNYLDGVYFFDDLTIEAKLSNDIGNIYIQDSFWHIVTYIPMTHKFANVFDTAYTASIFILIQNHPFSYLMALIYATLYSLTVTNHALFTEKFRRLSQIDPLTQAFNRRHGFELLHKAIEKHQKSPYPLSLIFIDVDHLKEVNDEFDHKLGDQMLIFIVSTFERLLPKQGSISRIGGDEFLILLPDFTQEEADNFISQVQHECRKQHFGTYQCEFSVGNLLYQDEYGNADGFVKEADALMYKDKMEKKTVIRDHLRNE